MNLILGMRTFLSEDGNLQTNSLFSNTFSKISIVPLQCPSFGLMFRRSIIIIPFLSDMTCLGKPLGQRVLIYSTLKCMISLQSSSESALLRLLVVPGTQFCKMSFRASTSLLVGAKIVLPSNHFGFWIFMLRFGKFSYRILSYSFLLVLDLLQYQV